MFEQRGNGLLFSITVAGRFFSIYFNIGICMVTILIVNCADPDEMPLIIIAVFHLGLHYLLTPH